MKRFLFVSLLLAMALCQCKRTRDREMEPFHGGFSYSDINQAACQDLDSALRLVSEGGKREGLSDFDVAFISAQIVNKYSDDPQRAIDYCRQALAYSEANNLVVTGANAYSMLAMAAYKQADYDLCLESCSKSIELSHVHKLPFVEASSSFLVGLCQYDMGLKYDGLALMNDALERTMRYVKRDSEYEILVEMLDRLSYCYYGDYDYENLVRISDLLEKTYHKIKRKFPDAVAKSDRDELFICPYKAYLGRAIAEASLGQLDAAKNDFEKCRSLEFANTTGAYRSQIGYYLAIGAIDSALAISERQPFHYADSTSRLYLTRLSQFERAFRMAGDNETANLYHHQIDSIERLVVAKEKEKGWATKAAQYNSLHYRLSNQSIHDNLKMANLQYFLGIMIGLLLALAIVLVQIGRNKKYKRRAKALETKTETLEKEIGDLRKKVQLVIRDDNRKKDDTLPLVAFIEEKQLYLNNDISREQVAEMMGITQRTMTKMLNQIRPDLSFPDYIRSLRIAHALNVMKANPDYTIQQVAEESGFYSISSFERAFKSITGKTPKAFMKEAGKETGEKPL